ncbi:hypothetical protein [Flavobacterium sp.]|uniref:hypothetical protein n=1 Tax=Flavobacterium sp. TaxID=239 RepID=UPI0040338A80
MKKIIIIMMVLSLYSCSSDDSNSTISEPIEPTPTPARSYRMMPCLSVCMSFNLPLYLTATDITLKKKRGNGQWVEQPMNSILWVQNNDSVWFKINRADGFIPNEYNYLDYQIFNKDTLGVNDGNKMVRFDAFNENVDKKLKIEFHVIPE